MKLCREHGIAVWDDEVQTFGRTTSMFAYDALELGEHIDIVTVGKMTQACATLFTEAYNPAPASSAPHSPAAARPAKPAPRSSAASKAGTTTARKDASPATTTPSASRLRPSSHDTPTGSPTSSPTPQPAPAGLVGGLGGMMRFTPFGGSKEKIGKALKACYDEGVILFSCGHGPYHIRMLPPLGVMKLEDWPRVFEIVERGLARAAA
jgi:4-aminobutyrate aminotransferase-like enzyme